MEESYRGQLAEKENSLTKLNEELQGMKSLLEKSEKTLIEDKLVKEKMLHEAHAATTSAQTLATEREAALAAMTKG